MEGGGVGGEGEGRVGRWATALPRMLLGLRGLLFLHTVPCQVAVRWVCSGSERRLEGAVVTVGCGGGASARWAAPHLTAADTAQPSTAPDRPLLTPPPEAGPLPSPLHSASALGRGPSLPSIRPLSSPPISPFVSQSPQSQLSRCCALPSAQRSVAVGRGHRAQKDWLASQAAEAENGGGIGGELQNCASGPLLRFRCSFVQVARDCVHSPSGPWPFLESVGRSESDAAAAAATLSSPPALPAIRCNSHSSSAHPRRVVGVSLEEGRESSVCDCCRCADAVDHGSAAVRKADKVPTPTR